MSYYTDAGYTKNSVFRAIYKYHDIPAGSLMQLSVDDGTDRPSYKEMLTGKCKYLKTPPKNIDEHYRINYDIEYFGEMTEAGSIIKYGTKEYDAWFNGYRRRKELQDLYSYYKEMREEYDRIAEHIYELLSLSTELDDEITTLINKHKLK